MAANKFATMLHKNTHRVIVILVYAVLEWVLILLLLLNSSFSYLIGKFATYFGLKPPCSWCSSINHYLEPNNDKFSSYRDLVCEAHANEISRLCYCLNHRKLAESERLCRDCSPVQTVCHGRNSVEVSFFSWRSEKNVCGDKEREYRCSCCGEDLRNKEYVHPPSLLLEPVFEYEGKSILERDEDEKSSKSSKFAECGCDHDHGIKHTEELSSQVLNFHCGADSVNRSFDEGLMIRDMKCNHEFDRLIPVELTDSSTISRKSPSVIRGENGSGKHTEERDEKSVSKQWIERNVDFKENEPESSEADLEIGVNECEVQTKHRVLENGIMNSSILMEAATTEQTPCRNDKEAAITEQQEASEGEEKEDTYKLQVDENPSETMLVLETSDPDPAGITRAKEASGESEEGTNLHLYENPEAKERTEEKIPVGPTSIYDLHQLYKKGFWNGSGSEGDDGIEMLKAELEAERKALSALYTELEEERNAAAISTNQTMAMITRLQEEKAAMQMEALQYQRMMDEQSDYDQEALQLLNELMIKREKEKQELEKELEMYRKEERMKLTRRSGSMRSRSSSLSRRSSSVSRSNAEEENEEVLIEPDCEQPEETDEAWIDCIKHLGSLEESVKEFEEERISILDELKELEEKLFILVDNDEQFSHEDVKSIEPQFPNVDHFDGPDGNDYGDRKSPTLKANWLLPLFDAAATEEGELNNEEQVTISQSTTETLDLLSNYEMLKRVAIEEDIDHVYERLQALEADREFVKHCVSSMKKGDKGMDLLQEILQHLRDLKAVESQVRSNIADSPRLSFSTWESGSGGENTSAVESSVQLRVE